jgi:hypothetical protein
VWIDRVQLPLDIISLLSNYAPWAYAAIAASLVSIDGVCAENPDPPEPFTVQDVIVQTASTVTAGAISNAAVIEKAYRWLRYQQFLTYCQCKLPPTDPTHNCVSWSAPLTIGSLGNILGPFPVTIDQAVYDSFPTFENGTWTWFRQGHGTVDGGAHTGNSLNIQYLASNGTWVTVDDIQTLNSQGTFCNSRNMSAATPKFSPTTSIRIVNNAGGTHQISDFSYCFCATTSTPPPLPVQPPFTGVPVAPVTACSTDDLCRMITELSHRLTNVSGQVSDIQAVVTTRDVLEELSRQTISGEGEATLVLGTRAVSVELTAIGPEAYTSALGRPRGLMRVGSLRYGDGIGYSPRRFIDADRFDDPLPVGALTVSWQLLPGTSGILKHLG